MKIALVHEFLTQLGGAERVLDSFLALWPKAPVYTLVYDAAKVGERYGKYDIRPSYLQKLPGMPKSYKWYLSLMPSATEAFDLSGYDVVLSICSAYVKGVKIKPPTIHISYVCTPTRYLWSDSKDYLKNAPIPAWVRPIMPPVMAYLRKWDYAAAWKPDIVIGDSEEVARRIKKYYNREADAAIFPPVDTRRFKPTSDQIGDYFLIISRQEPYKRTDLAISAANKLGVKLIVAGGGTHARELQKIAGSTIEFVGRVSDEKLADLYAHAKALIFPQEEDAGITPLESMAAGRPVIAYGKAGALETVVPGKTGEFFYQQTVENLAETISKFDPTRYDSNEIRKHATGFDINIFQAKIVDIIENAQKIIAKRKERNGIK